jgi:hypothetical protein
MGAPYKSASRRGRFALCSLLLGAIVASHMAILTACSNGNRNATDAPGATESPVTVAAAEALLKRIVLSSDDVGANMTEASARIHTNDQLAEARADTDFARGQYDAWGQVLTYAVQFDAAQTRRLVDTGKPTRISNTATVFHDETGASTQLIYVRAQSEERLANAVTHEGAGTRIVDAQVTKDLAFPDKGAESFAWRISGKATFETGTTLNFISDTVFVRVGNITGSVTAVGLGSPPDRATLERLVDRFIEKIRAERAES